LNTKRGEIAYKIVDVSTENIDACGLLCFQSKKNTEGYRRKVEWVKQRFNEGLRIKLLLVDEGARRGFRTRGFIEYIPGEYSWRGITADGYMVIHCIWVVGRAKGHGFGSKLLEQCLDDAASMNGAAVVTGRTWLPGPGLFVKKGFVKVGSLAPDVELYAKRFKEEAQMPHFNVFSKEKLKEYSRGITVFTSNQCPYSDSAVKEMNGVAQRFKLPIRIVELESSREAQHSVHPYGTFCVVVDGEIAAYRPIGARGLIKRL
jgi:GNAT superfamily N-acetyltransferase